MTHQEIKLIRQTLGRKSKIAEQIEKHVTAHESLTKDMKKFNDPLHAWYGYVKWRKSCDATLAHHQRMITLLAAQL